MSKQLKWVAPLAIAAVVLSSCSSSKKIAYLQDMQLGTQYPIASKYEAVVHSDDLLGITVSCKNPELAIPFNIASGSFTVNSDGSVNTSSAAQEKGYRVDVDGNIDFPILGKLRVEGLKVGQVKQLITDRIIEGNYINEPLVSIEFLNFKYTVLGAVSGNGTYTTNGDRVTLLDAIAKAGDLTSKAKIDRVAVIREINGERQMFVHDLRDRSSVFDSPCFYLQQNDIVYVEPRYRKKDTEDRTWQIATTLLSAGSLATSIIWVTKD